MIKDRAKSSDTTTIALARGLLRGLLGSISPEPMDPEGTYVSPTAGLMPNHKKKRAEETLSKEPSCIVTHSPILLRVAQVMVKRGEIGPVEVLDCAQQDGEVVPIWIEVQSDGQLSRRPQPGFFEVESELMISLFPSTSPSDQ